MNSLSRRAVLSALPTLVTALAAARLGAAPTAPSPAPAADKAPVPVWSLAFSPDGRTLSAGRYQNIQLWDLSTQTLQRTLTGHAGPVRCLAWSADGKQLAGGGGRPGELGEVKVWNAEAGTPVSSMQEHKDVVEGLTFTRDGGVLLSAGADERVLALRMPAKQLVRAMADHNNRVLTVAVSPDGKYVATGSLDRTIKIWDGREYKPLANTDFPGGQVFSLTFLPARNQFAATGEDGNTRLYSIDESRSGNVVAVNLRLVRTLGGNRTPVFAVAAAEKANVLALGGLDRTVSVYDSSNGNRKHVLKDCTDAVFAVAVSPDGSLVAAGGKDGKIYVWNAADGKLTAQLQ